MIMRLDTFRKAALGVIIAILAIALYYLTDPLIHAPTAYWGQPSMSADFPNLQMNIRQILNDEDRIYILFNSSRRIVQVYDLEGNYQHTLFFYRHNKGAYSMCLEEKDLYIQDERGNVYLFADGTFIDFYTANEFESIAPGKTMSWDDTSEVFTFRDRGIYRKDQDKEICIIAWNYARPMSSYFLLLAAVLFVVALIKMPSKASAD